MYEIYHDTVKMRIFSRVFTILLSSIFVIVTADPFIWKSIQNIGPSSCILECQLNARHCGTIRYDSEQYVCELLLTENDVLYGGYSNKCANSHQNLKDLLDGCSNKDCPAYSTCALTSHTNITTCVEADCPVGYYRNNGRCDPCQAGTYKDLPEQRTCSGCPMGHHQPDEGQSYCLPCTEGSYASTVGNALCTPCPQGKYQEQVGMLQCDDCPAGTYQDKTGQNICKNCPVGYSNSMTGQAQCSPCRAGEYQPNPQSTSCLTCNPGYFQSRTGQTSCDECPAGYVSNDIGMSSCIPCEEGTYQNNKAETTCKVCTGETFTSTHGATSCKTCPSDCTFQDNTACWSDDYQYYSKTFIDGHIFYAAFLSKEECTNKCNEQSDCVGFLTRGSECHLQNTKRGHYSSGNIDSYQRIMC